MKQNVNIYKLKMVIGEKVYGEPATASDFRGGKPTLTTKCSNKNIEHEYFLFKKKTATKP